MDHLNHQNALLSVLFCFTGEILMVWMIHQNGSWVNMCAQLSSSGHSKSDAVLGKGLLASGQAPALARQLQQPSVGSSLPSLCVRLESEYGLCEHRGQLEHFVQASHVGICALVVLFLWAKCAVLIHRKYLTLVQLLRWCCCHQHIGVSRKAAWLIVMRPEDAVLGVTRICYPTPQHPHLRHTVIPLLGKTFVYEHARPCGRVRALAGVLWDREQGAVG